MEITRLVPACCPRERHMVGRNAGIGVQVNQLILDALAFVTRHLAHAYAPSCHSVLICEKITVLPAPVSSLTTWRRHHTAQPRRSL